jgi:crotonobetainyl-CoA:carnitine CoA-transferase CaiB-like acyl-CoA transferase
MTSNPLAGIRVLDLTSVVVGPACTVRLAGYGADVVKIESIDGDQMRALGGPSPSGRHSGSYLQFNRGKKAVCLDLKHPAAREIVARLLDRVDVVVSNMRPIALERLGLDAETVRRQRPRLIHCTITGFGPGGPYRGRAAYDSALQGASGIAGLFGRRDGTPKYVPLLICDHVVGEIAAGAVMAALYERSLTGMGSAIEVPMFETMAAFVLQEHLGPMSFEPPLGGVGDSRVLNPDNRPLETADGWISLTANTDAQTHAFLRAVGREDAISDPRFRTTTDRYRNVDAWFALRASALTGRTTAEWLNVFTEHDVPAMPCHTPDSLLADPHLDAVGLIERLDHATEGEVRGLRPTVLKDGVPYGRAGCVAAPIGWDTRDVLADLGFGEAECDALIASGAARSFRSDSRTVESRMSRA